MKQLLVGFLALFIIGATAPITAQRMDAPTYGQYGAYAVGTRELHIDDAARPLTATIWYPALNADDAEAGTTYRLGLIAVTGSAISDAAVDASGGPYPLVVFSHGNGGMRFQSLFFTERLASYGFVVMAVDHPDDTVLDALAGSIDEDVLVESLALRPLDMLRLIDYADALNRDGGDFDGLIDMARIGVTGHSFGGYTALAVGGAQLDFADPDGACATEDANETNILCALRSHVDTIASMRGIDMPPDDMMPATTDSRIGAVVAMAPASGIFTDGGIARMHAPTMVIAGSADAVLDITRNADASYDALGDVPKVRVVLENGGHYLFVESCAYFSPLLVNAGLFRACSDPVWDMDRAHDLIDHFSIAFLLYALKGDPDALTALHAETAFVGVDYDAELPETP